MSDSINEFSETMRLIRRHEVNRLIAVNECLRRVKAMMKKFNRFSAKNALTPKKAIVAVKLKLPKVWEVKQLRQEVDRIFPEHGFTTRDFNRTVTNLNKQKMLHREGWGLYRFNGVPVN